MNQKQSHTQATATSVAQEDNNVVVTVTLQAEFTGIAVCSVDVVVPVDQANNEDVLLEAARNSPTLNWDKDWKFVDWNIDSDSIVLQEQEVQDGE